MVGEKSVKILRAHSAVFVSQVISKKTNCVRIKMSVWTLHALNYVKTRMEVLSARTVSLDIPSKITNVKKSMNASTAIVLFGGLA